jgi:eukaryotic-like serine/threonine-protein kinase
MEEDRTENRTPGEVTCPACGAPADQGQLVCLKCGSRMALDYRRPFGWKLPVAIVTAVLVLTGGGLAFALSEINDDAKTELAKEPPARAPAGGEERRDKDEGEKGGGEDEGDRRDEAKREPKPHEPKPAKREPKPAKRSPAPARPGTWPRGRSGYTVVLASTEDRRSAVSLVRNVRQRGNSAGYLRSNDYSSLEPGFWIVFSGVYRTRAQAARAANRLGRAFPGVFPQFVNGAESAKRR